MMKLIIILMILNAILYSKVHEDCSEKGLNNMFNVKGLKDSKVKKSFSDWVDEKFGLTPYRPNYLLPFGYTTHDYKAWTPTDGTYKNYEAEFQVSLKLAFKKNLLGYGETWYGAYSQRSFWQLYIKSAPFRESNYNPEVFVTFPVGSKEYYGLKSLTFGYSHISNGQGNIKETDSASSYPTLQNRSRSLNTLFAKATFQQGSFLFDLKFWTHIASLSDNPDIMDYYGYGRIKALYFYKKNLFTLMGRLNPLTQKGAMEFTYSYPGYLDGVYLYVKVFSGYGESLIDYNERLTKYSIGFAFSR